MKYSIPLILGLCFAGATMASAQATLSFAALGPYTLNGSSLNMSNATIVGFQTSGTPSLQTLTSGNLSATLNGATIDQGFVGTGDFTGSSDELDVSYTTDSGSFNGSTYSVSGHWTYDNGTGSYAGLEGGGTFSGTFNPQIGNYAITQFAGTLTQAVPAPSAYAFLTLGVLGLATMRRRK